MRAWKDGASQLTTIARLLELNAAMRKNQPVPFTDWVLMHDRCARACPLTFAGVTRAQVLKAAARNMKHALTTQESDRIHTLRARLARAPAALARLQGSQEHLAEPSKL